jgi:putative ABC transport system ATP-binding protein
MSIVAIENLSKAYQLGSLEVYALRGLDLSIEQGEYVAIMGPSGSGKSTLLNVLGCLDRPTSGTYQIGGEDVSKLDDDKLSKIRGSRIGFVFQSYNLIAQLNVIENIEVPMFYKGFSEHDSAERAKEQRVAIARALANKPLIILADEPTGNLDTESGTEIMNILGDLHKRGTTLIIVTHDAHVAARTERAIHLLDGRIERQEYNHKR